jgi:uroporphyrinogen-III synthase
MPSARRRSSRLGHEALIAPVLRIAPTEDPAPGESWMAAIVTSAHAVEALSSRADPSLPVFAVGERTADTLRASGFSAVTAAEGDAASLSRLIREKLRPPLTLLHVAGRHHKGEPASSLRSAGFRVLTWEAYEAKAVESLPEAAVEALHTGKIGAVLHYSRRSADLFVRLAGEAGLQSATLICSHLCLSADVAAPLQAAGAAIRVAGEPSEDALLTLLAGLS